MNNTAYRSAWRILLALGILAGGIAVVNYHIPFSGTKYVDYAFQGPSGTVSFVYPVSRVKDRQRSSDGVLALPMIEDPLYFDIKAYVPFKRATFHLTYRNTTGTELALGIKRGDGSTGIAIKKFEKSSQRGVWTDATVSFDLAGASDYNNNYTFVLSVPGLVTEKQNQGAVDLARMRIQLQRDPISWHDIKNFIARFITL